MGYIPHDMGKSSWIAYETDPLPTAMDLIILGEFDNLDMLGGVLAGK